MKKLIYIFIAIITLVACNKKDDPQPQIKQKLQFSIKIDSLYLSNPNNIPFKVRYSIRFKDSIKQVQYDKLEKSYDIDTFYADVNNLSCVFKFTLKDYFNVDDIQSVQIFYEYLISTQKNNFYFTKNIDYVNPNKYITFTSNFKLCQSDMNNISVYKDMQNRFIKIQNIVFTIK